MGAPEVSGDITPLLWQLRQSGVEEIYLPPNKISAEGDDGSEDVLQSMTKDVLGDAREGAEGGE